MEEISRYFYLVGEFCLLELFLHFRNRYIRLVLSSEAYQYLVLLLCSRSESGI